MELSNKETNDINNLNEQNNNSSEHENNINKDNNNNNESKLDDVVKDFLKNNTVKLIILSFTDNNNVTTTFNQSMIQLAVNFTKLEIPFELIVLKNESNRDRGINSIVAKMLADDFTHILIVDQSITFQWQNVLKLIIRDYDVSGGCTLDKIINWKKIFETYTKEIQKINEQKVNKNESNQKKNNLDISHILAKTYNYDLVPFIDSENGQENIEQENGFLRVTKLSNNFMMIKRNVFETISQKFETIRYQNTKTQYDTHPNIRDNFFSFFEYKKDLTSNIYMSSYETFCKRWSDCGGKIWVDLHCNLNITGEFIHKGAVILSIENNS